MKIKLIMIMGLGLMLYGCTDASRASLGAYGQEHRVRMYNGGVLVEEWISTGKVVTIVDSDGWQFMDKSSGKLVRVSGDVIIEVIN